MSSMSASGDAHAGLVLQLCRDCFYRAFEDEGHETIIVNKLFAPGERIAVAASGGKDSTVLAHVMTTLNKRHGCYSPAQSGSLMTFRASSALSRCQGAARRHTDVPEPV